MLVHNLCTFQEPQLWFMIWINVQQQMQELPKEKSTRKHVIKNHYQIRFCMLNIQYLWKSLIKSNTEFSKALTEATMLILFYKLLSNYLLATLPYHSQRIYTSCHLYLMPQNKLLCNSTFSGSDKCLPSVPRLYLHTVQFRFSQFTCMFKLQLNQTTSRILSLST